MNSRLAAPCILIVCAALYGARAHCAPLPASCAGVTIVPDAKSSLAALRKRVEAENETDPPAAFALLCTTIPRVEREKGPQSPELAWWVASLATPLIAYMDKFDEALPLLQFAQPILEKQYGVNGEPLGDIHVAYAWIYTRLGRAPDSEAAWESALKVRERKPGLKKIELQKVLVGLAQSQLSQRKFDLAELNIRRAHRILVENHDIDSEAGAAIENVWVNITFRQERYAEAHRHAEEQLRIETTLKNGAAQLVPAYALLGRILERQDEYEQAEKAERHALELSEDMQGPLQRHRLSALTQLSILLNERGHPAEARMLATRALSVGESTVGHAVPRLVPVLQTLGDTERQLGNLPEALHDFERAGAIVAVDHAQIERAFLVSYYHDLGTLQLSLGDIEQAERSLAAGLDASGDDPTLSFERASLLLAHAQAVAALGKSDGREELLQALSQFRTRLPETHPAILRALNQLCGIEAASSTSVDPPSCAQTAEKLRHGHDLDPSLRAAVYLNQSKLAQARGDLELARLNAIRGMAAAETSATPESLSQAYMQLAYVESSRGRTDLAVFLGKQALEQIQRERSFFVGADLRLDQDFLRDKVTAYRRIADWLLELGRIDEGLAVLKLMKTQELADFGVRGAVLPSDHGVVFTDSEQSLQDRYRRAVEPSTTGAATADQSDAIARLSQLEQHGYISPTEREYLRTLLANSGAGEMDRASRIDAALSGDARSARSNPVERRDIDAPSLTQIARGFSSDTAFVVYLLSEDHLRILVSIHGTQQEFRVSVDAASLQRDIGHYLDDIVQRHDSNALSNRLYTLLAAPVDRLSEKYRVRRWVLWLDGPLRYVPIAALRDGQKYLLDKYIVQMYAPAQAAHAQAASSSIPQVRGFGVTQAVGGFPALPAVADEMCYVVRGPIEGLHATDGACPTAPVGENAQQGKGALQGQGFVDAAFTAARFEQLMDTPGSFSVLHIGTHFRLRPGNALRSFLLLGDGSKLTLDTMGSLNFSAVDVVTLSACETGMGGARTDDGREIEGLSALVQRRGAGRVIASLWRVEDVSTAQLMRSLYQSFLTDKGDAAMGLREAQLALRNRLEGSGRPYADPYYWAGFYISGSHP